MTDVAFEKPRLAGLLEHFSRIADFRASWRVMHPLPEVLLLVVCGTIASGDDYEDIVDWGEAHLGFLRRFLPYYYGLPCADWLRTLMNRIDPELFSACFLDWVRESWPEMPDLVALDGKTSRRSHDRAADRKPLHLVSAFATNQRLVLGQEAVDDKSNETTAIPRLLERLAAAGALSGAVVTIDAVACNPKIAGDILQAGADYLLAVKANQPSLRDEIARFFADAEASEAPAEAIEAVEIWHEIDKDHGRLETRRCLVSRQVDWLTGTRRFPGEHRFPRLAAIALVETTAELHDRCYRERRYDITSRPLSAEQLLAAVRAHWRIENSLHWVLDVHFKDDLSRLRKGHGARNMAVARHFALNLVRTATDKRSLKTRRKRAAWDTSYLEALLLASPR
jgi:predicted transposase YbfD/YdcC